MFAQQHATCTSGPSLPNHIPEATTRHFEMVTKSVHAKERNTAWTMTHKAYRFDSQCPATHEPLHNKASQNRLDLGNTTVFGVWCIIAYQYGRACREKHLIYVSAQYSELLQCYSTNSKYYEDCVFQHIASASRGDFKSLSPRYPANAFRQIYKLLVMSSSIDLHLEDYLHDPNSKTPD